ncbi:MAG TPA: hypothetical protein VE866_10830 [Candidatus Binatia bacterium]|nr:hypothetical protein [Candidatus Binatia bacterium]
MTGMTNLNPASITTPHAYRMKVSRSGVFLTLAALLMLVGIRVAARGFLSIDIPVAPLRVDAAL